MLHIRMYIAFDGTNLGHYTIQCVCACNSPRDIQCCSCWQSQAVRDMALFIVSLCAIQQQLVAENVARATVG